MENSNLQQADKNVILSVKNLKKYFPVKTNFFGKPTVFLKAVDDVSFDLERGKTIGIVGESGCGKTTMGRALLRLYDITGGEVKFFGVDPEQLNEKKRNALQLFLHKVNPDDENSLSYVEIEKLPKKQLRLIRPELQVIFQDPYSSLSPRIPVGDIIGEAVLAHNLVLKQDYRNYILDIMQKCGLQTHYYSRYPHEFSGGQRQRICIARALALKPKVVVCDEPVSALDVSIQSQIINLLKDLQEESKLSYIFISHDLSVVEHISDEVGVMYLGGMVEFGSKKDIFKNPMHPYTKALLSAVPVPDTKTKMNRIILTGDIPSPTNPPKGCKFHTRCTECMEICKTVPPAYMDYGDGHFAACHLYNQEVVAKKESSLAEITAESN